MRHIIIFNNCMNCITQRRLQVDTPR
uniref:Uncharacterized protein n=2 Tax=Lepeophtheirus salmonis TaxID=72036 RepID=A0A0K2UDD7_LEPSM